MKSSRLSLPVFLILAVGCASHKMFVEECNFDVGRPIREIPLPHPTSIEPIDAQTSRYIYEYKNTGCRWSYTVDNKTERVLSWQYLSDPNCCYVTMYGP